MASIEKSTTITKFLNDKSPKPKRRSITPKRTERGKTKVEIDENGDISIEMTSGAKYKGKIDGDMQVNGPSQLNFEDSQFGLFEFQGNLTKNKIDGFGELNLEDAKLHYKGNFNNNKIDGIGRLNSDDVIYYGQWISNKFNGYGRIIKKNFALYEGLFIKDNRDGHGIEVYQNSDVYIGEFKKDCKSGIGTYFFYNGGFYYGSFKDNMREGFGTLYNKRNILIYRGYWKADKKDGRGIEIYKNCSMYNGYFANNMRNGIGFMEYSKNLLYMGEWKDNLKHGSGKLDVGKKSIIGKFHNDEIIDNCFMDVSKFADKINNNQIEESMEEYLKNINYNIKDVFIRGLHDLYKILKESLVDFILKLVEMGVLRLKVFILLKNLFSKAAFENILEDIKIFLKYEPNMYYLLNLWETSIAEIFRDKTDYRWNIWMIEESKKEDIFKENQSEEDTRIRGTSIKENKTYVFTITKTEEVMQLTITNRIAKGENNEYEVEGVLNKRGFELRYYSKETGQWIKNVDFTIYPFYITMSDDIYSYMISMKLIMYTGEFFFYNDNSHPLNLIMFLGFDANDNIYSVSLDSVGSFVIAGEHDKQKSSGKFVQKYFEDYKIDYQAFLMNQDKIQGYWSTTNINGHFILRRNDNFKFSREVAKMMEIVIKETDKLKDKFDLFQIDELELLLNSSIIPVLVKGSQGGIPLLGQPKKEEEDFNLFEKYKKKNEEEHSLKSPLQKKRTSFHKLKNESKISNDSPAKISLISSRNTLVDFVKVETNNQLNNDRNLKFEESEGILNKVLSYDEDPFKKKLSKALKQLKQAEPAKLYLWKSRFDPKSENIAWIGYRNLLGKEEAFIIDNLYITSDRIEGHYIDEMEIEYELAGSYSNRTKNFEIIGLSQDKNKTIKFKGEFKDFQLKGTLVKRPYNGPQESFEVKMFGYDARCDIELTKDNTKINNLPCILKITEFYIYAIVAFEKDFVFLNGYRNSYKAFNIGISTVNKRLKNCSIPQVIDKNEPNNLKGSDVNEKKMTFSSEEMTIIIRY